MSDLNVPKGGPYEQAKQVVGPDEASRTGAREAIQAVDKPTLPERYKHFHTGKVRETYINPDNENELIIIATDRISTHDVVHNSLIPGKGTCLTQISNHWFDVLSKDERTKHIPSQMISPQKFPDDFPEEYKSRAIVVKRLKALPIEAIVRGYLYGSAFKGYNTVTGYLATGEQVGSGLDKCSKFSSPLFTPSIKVEKGHDVNVNFTDMVKKLVDFFEGDINKALDVAEKIRNYSMTTYNVINEYAQKKGVTLGDMKDEYGIDENGVVYMIDEKGTPDCSRYWTSYTIIEGQEPVSRDKQAVRDYVVEESEKQGKKAGEVAITLTPEVINKTVVTYSDMTDLLCAA